MDYQGNIDDNFSFIIYENKENKEILVKALVPSKNTPNKLEYYYQYSPSSKELKSIFYSSDYNNLMTDKYTKIYTSGKFAE